VKLLMSLGYDDPADAQIAAIQRWFADGLATLGAAVAAELEQGPALNPASIRTDRDYGQPGQAWGQLSGGVGPFNRRPGVFVYSPANFDRLLRRWVPERMFEIQIRISRLDEQGRPHSITPVTLVSNHLDTDPNFLQLEAWCPDEWFTAADYRAAALRWWREIAEDISPTYGEVSNANYLRSGLEMDLGLSDQDTVPRGRDLLRGYSWLTIASQEVGDRLGGVDALRASGAFQNVERLARGGFWLQATDELATYGAAQQAKVHSVLAPALPDASPSSLPNS